MTSKKKQSKVATHTVKKFGIMKSTFKCPACKIVQKLERKTFALMHSARNSTREENTRTFLVH